MSTRTRTILLCDIPGTCLDRETRTVLFGLGADEREAEMCALHRAELAASLEPFIRAARPARKQPQAQAVRTVAARRRGAMVRRWALERGLPVTDRGRLPILVVARYDAEHGGRP